MRYKFKYKPYEHQLEALKKSWDKPHYALFMDMGTGKSKVLIDNIAMLYDKGEIDSALIIAPKGVYRNWERKELPAHLPEHITANVVTWSPQKTKKKQQELDTLNVVSDDLQIFLMNVEAFSSKRGVEVADKFLMCHRCMFAVDESTTIKSKGAARTKNMIKLGKTAPYKRILTGSPVTKSPLDLFTQCEFLDEGILGHSSFWTFQNRYAKMVRKTMGAHSFNHIVGYQNLSELNHLIEEFSFRVRKEDCLDLPDKVYTKRLVELTPEQHRLYEQMKRNALAIIEGEGLVSAPTVLTQLLRLQQVCSGFAKLEDGRVIKVPSNKLNELMSMLEEIDGKVIIWGNFTHDLELIGEALSKKYGEDSVELFYGGTAADDRQLIVERFQDPDSPLKFFVGQPRTGGYGLTLTEAKTVVYYSNGYDLEVRLQSEDRAHRIGQNNKVTYVDIIAEGTVDEKVLQALRSKIDISSRVLAEGYKEWII
jgi:SNF2 family DNA or RNA helicase|tara:strand:+ start:61 stop:1500 length:1440 start_codon:yes stop_codon:yes gene_type:complete